MKKRAGLLFISIILISFILIPVASAGNVTVSFSGEKNVKPGQTYTYNYIISMNNACGFFVKIRCVSAEISGDTDSNYDCETTNNDISVSGHVNIKINDASRAGDTITITANGRYSVVNEMGIPDSWGDISETYTLTVVSDEVPTPLPTVAPTYEPTPSITVEPTSNPTQEPEIEQTSKPSSNHSEKPLSSVSPSAAAAASDTRPSNEILSNEQPSQSFQLDDWNSLSVKLDLMTPGGTIVMSMDSLASVLPTQILKALKTKQGILIINFNEYSCTIDSNKLGVTFTNPVNLYMNMTRKAALSDSAGGQDIYQLHFSEKDDLPGCLTFSIRAFKNQPGEALYLYHYHAASGLAEYKECVTVDENGQAAFDVYEGGSYFVTESSIIENPDTGEELNTSQTSSTNDIWLIIVPVSCAIIAAIVAFTVIRLKRPH